MKIDMSSVNIKDILAKLSVLKSNLSLLASILIALVAVLLFIPMKLVSGKLEEAVSQKSIRMGGQIRTAKARAVSKDQWREVAKYESAYEDDANQIARLAIQSTQRRLLSYDIFPTPKDSSFLIFRVFGERFQTDIDGLLKSVNASDCPTDDELVQGMTNASATAPVGVGGAARRNSNLSARLRNMRGGTPVRAGSIEATIRDEICLSRAKSIHVYANPDELAGYAFWNQYKYDVKPEDAIQDCWYYQLGYWAIEDVISTIGSMNSGSANVLTAPVKRLLKVEFGTRARKSRAYGSSSTSKADASRTVRPSYVGPGRSSPMARSFTGRLTGTDIDVMHFTVSVIVGVKAVPSFMKELCSIKPHEFKGLFGDLPQTQKLAHNQITILQSKFVAVERSYGSHLLYRYGQDAIVELMLVCEYVFNAQAYEDIKPEEVKKIEPVQKRKRR